MAREVDTKVVEMRFDNAQFEKETKKTMSTLTKLKEALKFEKAGKGLQDLNKTANSIRLEGIAAGVDAITKQFTLMGTISRKITNDVADGLINTLQGAIRTTTDAIVQGGKKRAMNIENAHFQLQALLKDETKVQAVMADAMTAVDGTAYAYDEAAKAAAQFAASGIKAGDQMLGALKGITGVAAMTNSSFEDISQVFTTVAGNGRLMGDQLLQLSSRGLNAASTLSDYFKEVRGQADMTEATIREMVSKGELDFDTFAAAMNWAFGESAARANETFTGAMANMKSALSRIGAEFVSPLIEQNSELVKMFNAIRVKINEVKGAIAFDAQKSAMAGLMEVTSGTKDEFEFMFDAVKKNQGAVKDAITWIEQKGTKSVKTASQALLDYINGVQNGSIRASYAMTTAVKAMTDHQITMGDLQWQLERGFVSSEMFVQAMEHEYGNLRTIAKQTTDFILNTVQSVTKWINELDLSGPIEVMNDGFEILKNIMKAMHRVIVPIGQAFSSVFNFKFDTITNASKALVKFTSEMKISMNTGNKIHTIFKALFNLLKSGIDIVWNLSSALIKGLSPIFLSLGGALLDFVAWLSEGINSFVEWTRKSKAIAAILDVISKAFTGITTGISGLINWISKLIKSFNSLEIVKNVAGWFSKAFSAIDKTVGEVITFLVDGFGDIIDAVTEFANVKGVEVFEFLSKSLSDLWKTLMSVNWTNPTEVINTLAKAFRNLCDTLMENPGIKRFVENTKEYGQKLSEVFNWETLKSNFNQNKQAITNFFGFLSGDKNFDDGLGKGLKSVREAIADFMGWVKSVVGPFFSDLTIGGVLSTAGGFGIMGSVLKLSKQLGEVVKKVSSIPDTFEKLGGVFDQVKNTLVSYQKEIMADAILKIAASIGVLAGALVLLTFADPNRLLDAAGALTAVGVAVAGIIYALSKFKEVGKVEKEIKPMTNFAASIKQLSKAFKKAATILALGRMIKDIGKTLIMIAGSIVALGIFYTQNPEGFEMGAKTVAIIGGVLVGLIGLGTLLGTFAGNGLKNFNKGASAVMKLSLSLTVVIAALSKLMKLDFSKYTDVDLKIGILGGILLSMGVLALMFGKASETAGSEGNFKASSLLSACAGVYVVVMALERLMGIEFGDHWLAKIITLGGIMSGLGLLILALGKASKDAKGNLKAAGTILSMALAIGAIVVALGFLIEYPMLGLLKATLVLGTLLLALGQAIGQAAKVTNEHSAKVVLNMAIMVGTIVAALGFLSMIDGPSLLKAVTALGAVLLILAQDFKQAAKVQDKNSVAAILTMAGAIAVITTALYVLAQQPWEGLLAGAGSLSAVMLSLAGAFKIISNSKLEWNKDTLAAVGVMSAILAGVTLALMYLSNQPWEGLLAGATSLSTVLFSLAGALKIISVSKVTFSQDTLAAVGVMALILAGVTAALFVLAHQPWEGLLAGAAALSSTMIATSAALYIVAQVGKAGIPAAHAGLIALLEFIGVLALVIAAAGGLMLIPHMKEFVESGIDLLIAMFEGLGRMIGAIIEGALSQISSGLPEIGTNLSLFMTNLGPFITGAQMIKNSGVDVAVGILGDAILKISQANFVDGIAKIFDADLPTLGTELSNFMSNMDGFLKAIDGVKPEAAKSAGYVAEAVMQITQANMMNGIMNLFSLNGDMGKFAKDLKALGEAAKGFVDTVVGITMKDAETAKAVADVMYEIGEGVPAYGGLLGFFEGKQGLGDFGENLKLFGESVAEFAETVKNVKTSDVTAAQSVGQMFATLNDLLPETGGLKGLLFGGTKENFSKFGENIYDFGVYMVNFATVVEGLNTTAIHNAAAGFRVFMNLSEELGGKTSEKLVDFAKGLKKIGSDSVDNFIKAFTDSKNKVSEALKAIIDAAKDGLSKGDVNLQTQAKKLGENLVAAIQTGMRGNLIAVTTGAVNLALKTFQAVQSAFNGTDFKSIGSRMVTAILNGWNTHQTILTTTFTNWCKGVVFGFSVLLGQDPFSNIGKGMADGLINGFNRRNVPGVFTTWINGFKFGWISMLSESAFVPIGENIGKGLIRGMKNQSQNVQKVAYDLGNKAAKAVKRGADVRSPSRITIGVGRNIDEGVIVGMKQLLKKVIGTGEMVGEESASAMSSAIQSIMDIIDSESFDLAPTISPIVDLSAVRDGATEIRSIFDQRYDLSELYQDAATTASLFASRNGGISQSSDQKGIPDETSNPTYIFEQNNYSPKALSAGEIYRQTNNQISAFKRMVGI